VLTLRNLEEFQFSEDGRILHFMFASFVDEECTTTCKLSLSSFLLSLDAKLDAERLQRCQPDRQITYQFQESMRNIAAPFLLSYWTDDAVCIALPTLSCCPRIVKFRLPIDPPESASESQTSSVPETLRSPIFFPTSTPRRRPRLVIQERPSKSEDYLFLGLDTEVQTSRDGKDRVTIPPCVMRWKIPRTDGWRSWDPDKDERSEDLVQGLSRAAMLRGSFVDSERTFNVHVRSGLDWTRKSFLSCM
jgi:hypothetical protein